MKLSDLMRSYEDAYRTTLPPQSYTIVRVDGRAFTSLTRYMNKPFDEQFMIAMDYVAKALCTDAQGCQFAYAQSDEVSFLLTDFGPNQEGWFGGNTAKIISISAAIATATFNQAAPGTRPGTFDARVFTLPSRENVVDYFLWRLSDCHRNAVSMAARHHYSHRQLLGKSVSEQLTMLDAAGFDYTSTYPDRARNGTLMVRNTRPATVEWTHKRLGTTHTTVTDRHFWEPQPVPQLAYALLDELIPHHPDPAY